MRLERVRIFLNYILSVEVLVEVYFGLIGTEQDGYLNITSVFHIYELYQYSFYLSCIEHNVGIPIVLTSRDFYAVESLPQDNDPSVFGIKCPLGYLAQLVREADTQGHYDSLFQPANPVTLEVVERRLPGAAG